MKKIVYRDCYHHHRLTKESTIRRYCQSAKDIKRGTLTKGAKLHHPRWRNCPICTWYIYGLFGSGAEAYKGPRLHDLRDTHRTNTMERCECEARILAVKAISEFATVNSSDLAIKMSVLNHNWKRQLSEEDELILKNSELVLEINCNSSKSENCRI